MRRVPHSGRRSHGARRFHRLPTCSDRFSDYCVHSTISSQLASNNFSFDSRPGLKFIVGRVFLCLELLRQVYNASGLVMHLPHSLLAHTPEPCVKTESRRLEAGSSAATDMHKQFVYASYTRLALDEVVGSLVRRSITEVVFGRYICLVYVVNASVAASSWYPTLTCRSSKLVLLSSYTLGNCQDQRAKPGEGLRCGVCLHTRYICALLPALPPPPYSLPFHPPTFLLSSLHSPLLSPLLPLLLPLFSPLSPFTLPSFPWSKMSYGEGDMQSHRQPRCIGRSLTNPNLDP
ncbi:unnamed protein product [Schistocephalus solidus]|uniref:Uncharacterized protein n=1 Tax=Schistocephalus solidus TaxID=70667 RepID=A0A183SFN4_SCHSO|nr:unnamed protein product [Schistocephalus solidus]